MYCPGLMTGADICADPAYPLVQKGEGGTKKHTKSERFTKTRCNSY